MNTIHCICIILILVLFESAHIRGVNTGCGYIEWVVDYVLFEDTIPVYYNRI